MTTSWGFSQEKGVLDLTELGVVVGKRSLTAALEMCLVPSPNIASVLALTWPQL